jgi:hypothetical protein
MEVAMARTLRRTLSALVAALLSTSVSGPALAQTQIDPPSLQLNASVANTGSSKQKAPKELAAQRSAETPYGYRSEYTARATAPHYQWRWWQDYSNGGR